MDPWDKSGEKQRKEIILFKEERPKGDAILRGEELEVFYKLAEKWRFQAELIDDKIKERSKGKSDSEFEQDPALQSLSSQSTMMHGCAEQLENVLENKANS